MAAETMTRKGRNANPDRFGEAWWAARVCPEPNTGCHFWMGSVCQLGYGRVWYERRAGVLIHRVAYELAHGPIAPGLVVCHRCDNPSCVNVDHLFLGTQRDNLRDMFAKGRARPRGQAPHRKAS